MRRPSFPTVISLVALFVALGGTSYAVIKLPANSVGSREIKPNSVSGGDIRNGSIASKDLAVSARGQRGPRGPQGPPGSNGASGGGTTTPAPEAWKPLAFSGAWQNYGGTALPAMYRKDAAGRVYLRGLVAKGNPTSLATPASGDTIAILPAGYRPVGLSIFPALMGGGVAIQTGRVDVGGGGEIAWLSGPADPANYTSLDGISFSTD